MTDRYRLTIRDEHGTRWWFTGAIQLVTDRLGEPVRSWTDDPADAALYEQRRAVDVRADVATAFPRALVCMERVP